MGGKALSPPSSYQCFVLHLIAKGILQSRFICSTGNLPSDAVDPPVALSDFGVLRAIFCHFRYPALISGNFHQPVYRRFLWSERKKRIQTSATGLQCQFNGNPKIIIRKRFFYVSSGSGIFRTFQDAVFRMSGQVDEGNVCL